MNQKRLLAVALALFATAAAHAQPAGRASGPVLVGPPVVPTLTAAIRDLPDYVEEKGVFGQEAKRRDDHGIVVPDVDMPPHDNPLAELQQRSVHRAVQAFGTPIVNFAGATSSSSPPDDTGDVGPNHFLQGDNGSGGSRLTIYNKSGTQMKQILMETLGASPCNAGFCDPVIQYDELADRWLITEFDTSVTTLCVYVSRTNDPMGQWWAYAFNMNSQGGQQDYPKYAVWPDGYYVGVNNGGFIHVLDRARMLSGLSATTQSFSIPTLSGFGFQLTVPATLEGDAPPAGAPAIFGRPVDTEIHGGFSCAPGPCDVMDLWSFHVDWATPANSSATQLPGVRMAEFDHTLCGTGSIWNCMPQPGTSQRIDPIREPIHYPLQYRNWGSYQTLVGAFGVDVDGTDHAAVHWFEIRKTGAGAWTMFQEGVLGGEANVHRSVASAAMDGSGNIAVGYTRTGTTAPYYPSIYYSGRLAGDPLGTMPSYDNRVIDATTSKTNNERWGDYAGMGVDPTDDCTFWFTTEYGGSGQTRVASFKFDQCGCLAVPAPPVASASAPAPNRIDVAWNDSATTSITQYLVFRSTVSGGPYTQIATVPDSSPGVGNGPAYVHQDLTVSGGTTYYYVVRSTDGVACTSANSNQASATATGQCTLAPTFAGLATVTNPGNATCTLNLAWAAATSQCGAGLSYRVYRSTTSGFTPSLANRIATGVAGTSYTDSSSLVSGTPYFYVVRAVDTPSGSEDTNTTERSGIPTGPITTGNVNETFEGAGGFDNAGWTHAPISGAVDWVWSTARFQSPTHSWFSASQTSVADRVLTSPSFLVQPTTTMSFYHTYAFEGTVATCYDGGTLEYAPGPGYSTWTVVPDAFFTAGLYTGTVNTGYSNPIGGKRAWCAGTLAAMTQATVNLASLNGQNIKLRWHGGDDSSLVVTGWYVDSVLISNAGTAGSCVTSSGSNPKEASPTGSPMTATKGSGSTVNVAYTAGCGATDHVIYSGSGPIAGSLSWTNATCNRGTSGSTSLDPGTPAPGGLVYFVVVAENATKEGSYGLAYNGSGYTERPEGNNGAWSCNLPQDLTGSCP